MLSKTQKNIPLNAKYGLHFGRLGQLPTTEEFFRMQTGAPELKERLIKVDLAQLMLLVREHPGSQLIVEIPTLGFSDPILDYDIHPWFAIPLAINGFVGRLPNQNTAKITLVDLMGNVYPYIRDVKGGIEYQAIANQYSGSFYSTLSSIQYAFSIESLDGKNLDPLPDQSKYQNKLLICIPHSQASFEIVASVQNNKGKIIRSESVAIKVDSSIQAFTSKIQGSWHGTNTEGVLEIAYCCPEVRHLYLLNAQLSFGLPEKKDLKLLLVGSQQWISTHDNKEQYLTQYYGLSQVALTDLLTCLIPYPYFVDEIRKKEEDEIFQSLNHFRSNDQSTQRMYLYILSGLINRSIPLYALVDQFVDQKRLFERLSQLKTIQWELADQIVFKQMLCEFGPQASVSKIIDILDEYLSFGVQLDKLTLKIKTCGAKLAKRPLINTHLSYQTLPLEYPIPMTVSQTDFRPANKSDFSKKGSSKESRTDQS